MFCPMCNRENASDVAFCEGCGASLMPEIPAEQPKKARKARKLLLMVGLPVAAVLVAAALVVVTVFGGVLCGDEKPSYVLYFKDGELFYNPADKASPFQVSETTDVDDENANSDDIADYTQVAADGKTVFFPQDIVWDVDEEYGWANIGSYTLCRRTAGDETVVEIAKGVKDYRIDKKGLTVYYTDTKKNLYRYDGKTTEKIASDVDLAYSVSDDGKAIFYWDTVGEDETRDLYRWENGKTEEVSGILTTIAAATKDLKTIWYVGEDDALYKKTFGKDEVKIAEDVVDVVKVYASGEMLYIKRGEPFRMAAYFEDDMASSDAQITEPVKPTAPKGPKQEDYPSEAAYDAAYEEYSAAYDVYRQEFGAYQTALKKYWAKSDRDELREQLREATLNEMGANTLCYYDGKKETVLTTVAWFSNVANDKMVGVYVTYEFDKVTKVKMSEVETVEDVERLLRKSLDKVSRWRVFSEGTVSTVEPDNVSSDIYASGDGRTLGYLCGDDEGDTFDVYKAEIDGTIKNAQKIDEGAAMWSLDVLGSHVVYKKNVRYDDGFGHQYADLYADGQLVGKDVLQYKYNEASDAIVYMVDYDPNENTYTLKRYADGESVEIAKDVYNYQVLPNGNVAYMTRYDAKTETGDLYLFTGEASVLVDEDVTGIVECRSVWQDDRCLL